MGLPNPHWAIPQPIPRKYGVYVTWRSRRPGWTGNQLSVRLWNLPHRFLRMSGDHTADNL